MQKVCAQNSEHKFEVTEEDLKFYEKMGVPVPTLCPRCRMQRRMVFRNERKLYHRKCDLTGKQMISMYMTESPYKIYHQSEWWSDKWDARDYGKDFDFSRPFFEQFAELAREVPRFSFYNKDSENSEYCNYATHVRNCYLVFGSSTAEDCFYSQTLVDKNSSVMDSFLCFSNELCYENNHTQNNYNSAYLLVSSSCLDSVFLYDCRRCKNCVFCHNLRGKENYLFNQPATPAEIAKVKNDLKSYEILAQAKERFYEMILREAMHKYLEGDKNENVSGQIIHNSKNVHQSYMIFDAEDIRYSFRVGRQKDSVDAEGCMEGELLYECMSTDSSYNCLFCMTCEYLSESFYADICYNSKNLFGCIGIKKGEYCILNKQYTKEEYEELVPKIIEHMKKTGEWGEFFPKELSPHAYNESVAQDYFPLKKTEALRLGFTWQEEDNTNRYEGPKIEIADQIEDVPDEITKKILTCESCGKNYKIIPQELNFYRKQGVPVPHKCFNCRHAERLSWHNFHTLYESHCTKCGKAFQTVYDPKKYKNVYCEKCYLESLD